MARRAPQVVFHRSIRRQTQSTVADSVAGAAISVTHLSVASMSFNGVTFERAPPLQKRATAYLFGATRATGAPGASCSLLGTGWIMDNLAATDGHRPEICVSGDDQSANLRSGRSSLLPTAYHRSSPASPVYLCPSGSHTNFVYSANTSLACSLVLRITGATNQWRQGKRRSLSLHEFARVLARYCSARVLMTASAIHLLA